ncbi:restriction endonuclease subunit S [Christensenellaceae bacterium OttesenSCG-928-L17]|nr:restriction endonuclease subunit S [Christensenellaceae bacterium OttesenSCG-928-L17]
MVYDETLKREIPQNWQVKKLKDLFEFEKGTEPGSSAYSDEPKDGKYIKFFRVGDVDGSCQTFIDGSEYALKTVRPTDVIVTFDGSVGKLGLGLDGAISGGLRHIYDRSGKIKNATVWVIFSDPRIVADIEKYATGSVLKHASSAIDYLKMPYNEDVLLKFQTIIKPIFAQIVANKQESARLANLRDYLLPLLMNGQVSVVD